MRNSFKILLLISIFSLLQSSKIDGCTNILISSGASKDGSTFVTYAADSHQLYGELYYSPAQNWQAGSILPIYEWDSSLYLGDIPQVAHTFQTVGNMNEHQVAITETTFGGREELVNKTGIVDYGSLIYITLQRARTAREAIKIIDELSQEYGYPSEGESFSISDKNEVWIMEIVGKGDELGSVWVARRVPEGYVCAHANQSRIHTFPLNDPTNCIYSKDVISFARKAGYFTGKDEEFSFCDAFAPANWGALRGCEARVWSAFNIMGKGTFNWTDDNGNEHSESAEDYIDFASGNNAAHKMPLFIKPAEKVGIKEVADIMRDHYEGTFMDMTEDVGAGPDRLPYRWRPMDFEIDGNSYCFERAIATQQTGFWIVCQSRNWLPDEIGGILWFGVDDAATSPLTPVRTSITKVPESFAVGNGSMISYSPTSAFWQRNKLTHFAYLMYDRVAPVIRSEVDKYENDFIAKVETDDATALKMMKSGNVGQAVGMLTEESLAMARTLFDRWAVLENELLVKYMDGNVKIQNEDGSFKTMAPGSSIPVSPEHPRFRERWLRSIVTDHGEVLKEGK